MSMPAPKYNVNGRLLLPVMAAAALAVTLVTPSEADVSGFYKGREIKVIVSSGAGGGYDSYAQLLAKHIGRHIPGNPSAVVENMPGTGGLKATNHLYNVAPKDGSVIGGVQRLVALSQILGDKRAKFVASKFNWLGSMNNEVTVCVAWHQSEIKSFKDLLQKPLVIGGSGPNDTELVPAFLNNTLGTNFDIVSGYNSSTAITLAIESGEVEGTCSSYSSLKSRNADWFKNRKINILIQTSTSKHPDLPAIPLALDLAEGEEMKAMMALNESRLVMGRPFLAPPSVPADRVKALRTAFEKMVSDKALLADAKLQKREVTAVNGAELQALVSKISKVSKAMIERLNDAQVYKAKKAGAKIAMKEVTGPVTAVASDGRTMSIKDEEEGEEYKAKVSPTRTLVSVSESSARPDAIKVGMKCTIKSLGSGQEAIAVSCNL
ncbi:MAG: hypothetical protein RLZ98_1598 [Pseudomonadota bacterium]|jgi:tripartite-type tricarboxylate transporter receptor subunit TctC